MNWTRRNLFRKQYPVSSSNFETSRNISNDNESLNLSESVLRPKVDDENTISTEDEMSLHSQDVFVEGEEHSLQNQGLSLEIEEEERSLHKEVLEPDVLNRDFGTNKADIHMTNPENNNEFLEKIDQSKLFVESNLENINTDTFYIGNEEKQDTSEEDVVVSTENPMNSMEEVEIFSNADLNSPSSSSLSTKTDELDRNTDLRDKLDLIFGQLFSIIYNAIRSLFRFLS